MTLNNSEKNVSFLLSLFFRTCKPIKRVFHRKLWSIIHLHTNNSKFGLVLRCYKLWNSKVTVSIFMTTYSNWLTAAGLWLFLLEGLLYRSVRHSIYYHVKPIQKSVKNRLCGTPNTSLAHRFRSRPQTFYWKVRHTADFILHYEDIISMLSWENGYLSPPKFLAILENWERQDITPGSIFLVFWRRCAKSPEKNIAVHE